MVGGSKVRREDFRSGLEFKIAKQLDDQGYTYEYEKLRFKYQRKPSTYTPDFELHNGIIIEGKGRFVGDDRAKHLLVKAQHPELDIRFVFSNSRSKLYKGSKNTYGDWCTKHGFLYADKVIPDEWLKE
jgi:hypothetical protein